MMTDLLQKIYYEIGHPAAYSTIQKLHESVDKKIPKDDIKDWLSGELAYTLHRPRKLKFKRNPYLVNNINDQWQADLADLVSLSESNDGYKMVLLVVDTFSRFVRVRPLTSKSAKEVLNAFKEIIVDAGEAPRQLLTDRGKILSRFKQDLNNI